MSILTVNRWQDDDILHNFFEPKTTSSLCNQQMTGEDLSLLGSDAKSTDEC
jgi:hypothetical protein